jgi:hypothetical protein
MSKVALAEEPFQIAVAQGCGYAHCAAAAACARLPGRLVAGLVVIVVENGAGRNRIGPVGQGIGLGVLSEGAMAPKGTG